MDNGITPAPSYMVGRELNGAKGIGICFADTSIDFKNMLSNSYLSI